MPPSCLDEIAGAMVPLSHEFGLHVARFRGEGDVGEILFANATTGVTVELERRDLTLLVWLHQLPAAKASIVIPHGRAADEPGWRTVHFDGVLALRVGMRRSADAPMGWQLPRWSPAEVRWLADAYAKSLAKYAADVLHGDFTIFPRVEAEGRPMAERRLPSANR